MSSSADTTRAVDRLAGLDPADLSPADTQLLMELAVRAYGRQLDDGNGGPVLAPYHGVSATDVVRAASALLAAANLEVFELALWETWGGRPWTPRPGDEKHQEGTPDA